MITSMPGLNRNKWSREHSPINTYLPAQGVTSFQEISSRWVNQCTSFNLTISISLSSRKQSFRWRTVLTMLVLYAQRVFSSIHVSRDSVHRGGGVAVLYRDSIVATDKHQCVPHTCPTTFEYMSLALTVNSVVVRLVVVYRPLKSSVPCFIKEFAEYLELLSASTGNY